MWVHAWAHVCLFPCMRVRIYVCARWCVSICVWARVRVRVCMPLCVCACVRVRARACVHMCACACARVTACVRARVHVRVSGVCVCACALVRVGVRVCSLENLFRVTFMFYFLSLSYCYWLLGCPANILYYLLNMENLLSNT